MYLTFCSLQVRPEPNLACIAEQVWWSSRALKYKGVFSLGCYSQRSLTSSETCVTRALDSPNFLELFCIDIPDIADSLYLDTFHLQNTTGSTIYATQQTKIFPGLLTDLSYASSLRSSTDKANYMGGREGEKTGRHLLSS